MGETILGNRLLGITDALASSLDSIQLAMLLMLPYAGAILSVATSFVWWFLLASLAFTSGKILFRQANGSDLAGKIGLGIALLIAFFPIQYANTGHKLPLASYVTINLIELVDKNYRQGVDAMVSNLNEGDEKLPISMIRALNQNNLNVVDGSRLAPIVNDYVANCTSATLKPDPGTGEYLSQKQWRMVGLIGSGALGFEPSDYIRSNNQIANTFSTGTFGIKGTVGREIPTEFTDLRSAAIRVLNTVQLPGNTRSYDLPTQKYWDAKLNAKTSGTISGTEIDLPDQARFLSTHDYSEYQSDPMSAARVDLTKWYADDCYELYYLAHTGTRNYLKAMNESYKNVFNQGEWNTSEQTAVAAGSHAVTEAMRNFYAKSANREAAGLGAGSEGVSTFTRRDVGILEDTKTNGLAQIQGAINDLAAILLNINLDQWVITALGSLSIAIAFIAVTFPFFALLAPIVGGEGIITPLKVMIMLEVTLMLSYAIASIGTSLLAALNIVASNTKFSAYGMGDGTTALTVTVMTGMFIFFLFAGKLAHVLVFGSNGVGSADGRTVTPGKQAALAGSVVGAVASMLMPGGKAVRAARVASQAAKGTSGHSRSSSSGATNSLSSSAPRSGGAAPRGAPASGSASQFSRGQGRLSTPQRSGGAKLRR